MSMNGGDAAEQMVRILLDGTETVVKITGEGARQLAAFLYAWAQQERGKNPAQHGRTSMVRLLKSGQELQVFRLRKRGLLCGLKLLYWRCLSASYIF